MTEYSFYNPVDGAVAGQRYAGAEPELNAPAGCVPIPGRLDPRRNRVVLVTDDFGEQQPVVALKQPDKPQDTELQRWVWDEAADDWRRVPTAAALAASARARRDQLLAASDWVITRAFETGATVPPAWATYRAALRDVPAQPGFPDSFTWPTPPTT